jgi:NADH:ubiquinone oxidoreductase subunit 5 (subunit L)/multisubunit Na+/H+ antiporter MnhA subunit
MKFGKIKFFNTFKPSIKFWCLEIWKNWCLEKKESFEKNQRFLLNFGALSPNLVFKFFSARQVSEIFLNKSSKKTENALMASERDNKVFPKTKVYVISLVLSLVFKTVFGIFLSPLVCLKSV